MVESTASPAPSSAAAEKKVIVKKTGGKEPPTKTAHPPTSEMVNAALGALKDRKGSSLQAIKKYIAATYLIDPAKQAFYIKKYLKSAVENETVIQVKGVGASGRFKLAAAKPVATKKAPAKKPAAATNKKKSTAGKPKVEKKEVEKVTKKEKEATKPAAKPAKKKMPKSLAVKASKK